MSDKIDLEKARLDPASVFDTPEDVLKHDGLSKSEKVDILRRWEYDASEIAVAEEEGMQGEQPLILRRVILALEELTDGTWEKHNSPTKQDGS